MQYKCKYQKSYFYPKRLKNIIKLMINPRLPEPFFITRLPEGVGWLPPPYDFEIGTYKTLLFGTIV